MPPLQNDPKGKSSIDFNNEVLILGLDSLEKNLERAYFSNVSIRKIYRESTTAKLVLDVNCNFKLVEMIYHHNIEIWGDFSCFTTSLSSIINEINTLNEIAIEIEEMTFNFNDTSVIIHEIYKNSIVEQLDNILNNIATNFTSFSKGFSDEMPYEIYIPVLEDDLIQNKWAQNPDYYTIENKSSDYSKYWALYFYSQSEAEIYDVQQNSLTPGNLHLVNL